MVLHGDKGEGFYRLNYSRLPHREYRTTFHLIVHMLQPQPYGDLPTWDEAADIWNDVFHAYLNEAGARFQGGKQWRDQYVHRYAPTRPLEWREIDVPDDTLDAAEIGRRQVFARNIRASAQALGITLPNPRPAYLNTPAVGQALVGAQGPVVAQPPAVAHAPATQQALAVATASANAGSSEDGGTSDEDIEEEEIDEAAVDDEQMQDAEMSYGGELDDDELVERYLDAEERDEEDFDNAVDEEEAETVASEEHVEVRINPILAIRVPKRKREEGGARDGLEGYKDQAIAEQGKDYIVIEDNDNDNTEAADILPSTRTNPPAGPSFKPTADIQPSTRPNPPAGPSFKPIMTMAELRAAKTTSNQPQSLQTTQSIQADEEMAQYLQEEDESLMHRRKRSKVQQGGSADAERGNFVGKLPASEDIRKFVADANNSQRSKDTKGGEGAAPTTSHTGFNVASPSPFHMDLPGGTTLSPKQSGKARATFVRSKEHEQRYGVAGPSGQGKMRSSGSGLKKMTLAEDVAETSSTAQRPPLPPVHASAASTNASVIRDAPALPFIHARDVEWGCGYPHAWTSSDETISDSATSPDVNNVRQRSGKVVRGVLNAAQGDFMTCAPSECDLCSSDDDMIMLGSVDHASRGKPLVHSCCIVHDNYYGDSFEPVEGAFQELNMPFPKEVRSGHVQFLDGMYRNVIMCAGEKCEVCRRYADTGSMVPEVATQSG